MDRKRPTILDVATLAGASKSTVGRALSGNGSVAPAVRERIVAAARSLGYEPNELAVSMRSGRSRLIGLVIPDISNPFWAEVARGAQDQAAEGALSVLCFSSDWQGEREALHLRALVRARADGAIVSPVADNAGDAGALQALGLPLVLLGSSADGFPGLPSVGSDVPQAVRVGLDHLVRRGHGAPALIVGPPSRIARARFVDAVGTHLRARGLDAAGPVETGDYTVDGGRAAMLRLLDRPLPGLPAGPPPGPASAPGYLTVFAANDLMALGALLAARDRGLSCPEDVSVLGFDGIAAGAFSWPGLTTVEKPSRAIGRRAVEMLVEAVEGRGSEEPVRLPGHLIERGSVADLTARAARPARLASG